MCVWLCEQRAILWSGSSGQSHGYHAAVRYISGTSEYTSPMAAPACEDWQSILAMTHDYEYVNEDQQEPRSMPWRPPYRHPSIRRRHGISEEWR